MGLSAISYGQLTILAGGILLLIGSIILVAGNILFSVKRKRVKKELTDKYGF